MKIVFVISEMVPYAKTGGLADVAGTLPAALQALGHEVVCFLPKYRDITPDKWKMVSEIDRLYVPLGGGQEDVRILSHVAEDDVKAYFVDFPEFFSRDELYGTPQGDYPDNDRRFALFQRSVLEALIKLKIKPDIIHCHDWQTGIIPVYLKTLYAKTPAFKKTKSVFTIHNLAYQGNFPPDSLATTGLGWEQFQMQRLEFYGKVCFLKGGILDADAVTTVSERYSQEIQTEEFGCGLETTLQSRAEEIHGIVNGIDTVYWNPATDNTLPENYDASNLAGKAACKKALQKENELPEDPKIPLIGITSRLVDQKGLDILLTSLPDMMEMGYQFVLLGTGDEKYHKLLRSMAKKYPDQMGIHILFDGKMARRIYAGCDLFMLPSYYEPCGLGQMIALRYGSVPLVRETGGLADTIDHFDPETKQGNGFLFHDYTSDALTLALEEARKCFDASENWEALVQNAFACDFSWQQSAKKYSHLYEGLLSSKKKR